MVIYLKVIIKFKFSAHTEYHMCLLLDQAKKVICNSCAPLEEVKLPSTMRVVPRGCSDSVQFHLVVVNTLQTREVSSSGPTQQPLTSSAL